MKTDNQGQLVGFAVQPKTDCPHLTPAKAEAISNYLEGVQTTKELACKVCEDKSQNWVCLTCNQVFCSRYVKEHMAIHNAETQHEVALSFSDGSYWCYPCESYIDSVSLRPARKALTVIKTREEEGAAKGKPEESKPGNNEEQEIGKKKEDVAMLEKMFKLLGIRGKEQPKKISLDEVIDKLKMKQYKRVVVLTGAGISVAAGIPDFRSPGTGLYSKLQKYNLPYPEAIFEISYYKKQPKAFLTLSKELLTQNYQPTLCHKFIVKLHEEGLLHMNLTQNIDGLEINAGLPEEKIIQAHGHTRTAHCISCKKEADINKWKQLAAKQQPMKCTQCEDGLIKPDIIFFGENLPASFFNAPKIVQESDLAIIIGTSLKVMPFAYMAELIPPTSPVILINRDDVLQDRDYKIWLDGDIQETVKDLMTRLGWL